MSVSEVLSASLIPVPVEFDPAAKKVLDDARRIQQGMLLMPDIHPDRQQSIVSDLDSRWPLMHKSLFLSGRVTSPVLDIEQPSPDEPKVRVSKQRTLEGRLLTADYTVMSHTDNKYVSVGFAFVESSEAFMPASQPQLRLLFNRLVHINIVGESTPQPTLLSCSADIDAISLSSYDYSLSYAQTTSEEHFHSYLNRVTDDISIPGQTTVQSLLAIKEHGPVQADTKLDNSELLTEGQALGRYLSETISIGTDTVPYLLTIKEGTSIYPSAHSGEAAGYMTQEAKQLSSVYKLVYRLQSKDGLLVLQPRLVLRFLGTCKSEDSSEIEVALDDITAITSMRDRSSL